MNLQPERRRFRLGLLLSLAAPLLFINSSFAANSYPIILVHGFQPSQLQDRPNASQVTTDGAAYWADYWNARATARIDWPSQERIRDKITTDYVWPKLQQLAKAGTCSAGCVVVTHSTGDLVTRYWLENQATWLKNAGLAPLNIVATIDFAGAGGGSELADLALNVADGNAGWLAQQAVALWLGMAPTRANTGVLNDLQVNSARQLANLHNQRIPRIRMVGGASDFLGSTSPFLPGDDDGVVAPHSSCGSSVVGSYNSCSSSVALDGKLTSKAAPSSRWPMHYPMLMSDQYSHGGLIGASRAGKATTAAAAVSYKDGKSFRVSYTDTYYGFPYYATWRYVKGSESSALSPLVYQIMP